MSAIRRLCTGLVALALSLLCASVSAADAPDLIPQPASYAAGQGRFTLTAETGVYAAEQLAGAVKSVRLLLGPATGFEFPVVDEAQAGIRMLYVSELAEEAYRLETGPGGVVIVASTEAGVFYALQTLRQLLPAQIYSLAVVDSSWSGAAVVIEDEPRFGWRGLHLDVGRHFMPVEFIKKYIDLLAMHKMNTFHWHLTEDQGWRIEIKQYPKLTEIGSKRAQTVVGHPFLKDEDELEFDGTPHEGFYTQDEIREVVAYAAERHVNVVPEIEFPGHAQAAIAAYPELGNTGEQLQVRENWGISKNTIKPSEETLQFYRNVLIEVMALFPSEYIHIGGDEAPKDQWRESEYAQQRIQELGLADENELQSWLIGQIDEFLTANGRRMIGWDEIMQGGLSENATVMSWRGIEPGRRAAEAGHDVVMAPVRWTYFDYLQGDPDSEPLGIGMYLPLQLAYDFEPVPAGLDPGLHRHILGAQGQLWTEFMATPEHVEYMAYPRAIALSEVVWSPRQARDYDSFSARLPGHLERLDVLEVNYRKPGNDEVWLGRRLGVWFMYKMMDLYHWWADG